jgi:hypothetical protein
LLTVRLAAAQSYRVNVEWHGRAPIQAPPHLSYRVGEELIRSDAPGGIGGSYIGGKEYELGQTLFNTLIEDPQHALTNFRITSPGFHTVFADMKQGDCAWSLPISFEAKADAAPFLPVPEMPANTPGGEQVDLSSVLKDRITEIFTRVYSEPRSQNCSLAFPDNLLGGWANPDRATIDDAGLRAAKGMLRTTLGVDFATPGRDEPNCLFLSHWDQDQDTVKVALSGRARGVYLLMAGTTLPQCSRMQHGSVSVTYADGTSATLALRNPETWWPIEQDYLLDDYMFLDHAPLPPRLDLRTGETRILDPVAFHGNGRAVPGGAATVLHLPLDPAKDLASLHVAVDLYGIVIALMAATLARA